MKHLSCREWWYFALNANLNEIREERKRCTWDFLLHRARDAVSYTDKYFSKLKGGLLHADDRVRGLLLSSSFLGCQWECGEADWFPPSTWRGL